jgi:hypothetical protein
MAGDMAVTAPALPLRARAATALWRRVLLRSGLGPDGPFGFLWWLPRLRWERAKASRRPDLQRFESRRFSQNGEDGILAEILRRLDQHGGTAIEIGAADGAENCTRALVEDGWRAVWVEGDLTLAARARSAGRDRVEVVVAKATADNIGRLLDAAGAPREPEVLAVDIDGNDLQILEAVLVDRRPQVIVAEYNALAGPSWWVQPYEEARAWDHTAWHGAGLRALAWLVRRHGFALVGCDSTGVNAFFVRAERAADFDPGSPRHHYVPPAVRLPFGHPWIPRAASPALGAGAIEISALARRRTSRRRAFVPVLVRNRGDVGAHGFRQERALSLAARWAGSSEEPERRRESFAVKPHGRAVVVLRVDLPAGAGPHRLELFAVQEDVRWFGEPSGAPLATVELRARTFPPC